MNANYSVKILEVSREISAKERVAIKDTTSALKLDAATQTGNVKIIPDFYCTLSVHNDKATPTDYENYVIVDKSGDKYVTGSKSFWNSFMDIYAELADCGEEWGIEVYRVPSKNYNGKEFITCKVI